MGRNTAFDTCSLPNSLVSSWAPYLCSFVIVFLCLGLSVFATIEDHKYEVEVEDALFYLEIVVVIWFTIEFFFRYEINTSWTNRYAPNV